MSEIGKAGFAATVAKHWQGDAAGYLAYQRALANQSVIEALTDVQLRAELAKGKETASMELPCLDDYEPQGWEERVSRQSRGRSRAG